jgi:hypothetical protein
MKIGDWRRHPRNNDQVTAWQYVLASFLAHASAFKTISRS